MVADTLALCDHLDMDAVRLAGYSMGGWIAETICVQHPDRVRSAALIGSCNETTSWEKAITSVELAIAHSGVDLPRLFYACETMRYLPNSQLQDDGVVDAWLSMIGEMEAWPNPGREGQLAAAMGWMLDARRTDAWPDIRVPCLVLGFEHDVDSPPLRARAAAARIPGARFTEIADASHLGPMTHAGAVADELVGFFRDG
jgi:thioesterase CepJ